MKESRFLPGLVAGTLCLFLCAEPGLAQKKPKTDPAADQEYAYAIAVEKKGVWTAAVQRWAKFIATYPKDPRLDLAHHHLGSCQLQDGKFADAAKTFQTLISKYPKFASLDAARYNLGLAQFSLASKSNKPEDFSTAAKSFAAVPKTSEHAPAAMYYQAECLYRGGNEKQAIPVYAALIKSHPKSPLLPDVYYALGTAQQEQGLYQDAAKTFAEFTKKHPEHKLAAECKLREGLCLFSGEKFKQAESIFTALSKKKAFPYEDLVMLQLARCRHKADDAKSALKYLQSLLKKHPKSPYRAAAQLETGQCLFETGKFADAVTPLREVVALKTDESPGAAYWLAKSLMKQSKPAEAVTVLDQAIAAFAMSADLPLLTLTRIDALYEQPAKRKETVALYDAFARKHAADPLAAHALYMAGFAALAVEDYAAAAKHSTAFLGNAKLANHELVPDVLFVAGESLLLAKEPKLAEAARHYTQLLAKFPTHAQVPRARVRLGYCQFQDKKYTTAVQTLTQAVSKLKEPALKAEAYLLIGRSQSEAGNAAKAIAAFQSALSAYPKWERGDEVLLRLAVKLNAQKNNTTAEKHLKQLLSKYPKSDYKDQALYELGQIAESREKHDEAVKYYKRVLAEHKDSASAPLAAYGIGHALFAKDDFNGALQAYTQLISAYAKHDLATHARYDRAITYYRLKQYNPALQDLQAFLASKPDEADALEARFATALCQSALKQHEAAVAELQKILKEKPDYHQADKAYYELGYALKALKKDKEATAAFQQLVKNHANSPLVAEAWYNIGRFHRDAERWSEALAAYLAGATAAKKPVWKEELLYEQSYVQYRMGKLAEAALGFQNLLKAYPKGKHLNGGTYLAGECLFNQGEWQQALPFFTKSIQQNDERYVARACYRAGTCALRLKQWPQAEQQYANLVSKYPKFDQIVDATYGYGMSLQMQNKIANARKQYEAVIAATKGKNTKTRAQAQFMLGECDFAEKKYEDAIVRYAEAAVYPDKPLQAQCHYEAGRCFIELKRPADARKSLQLVIDKYPKTEEAKLAAQLIKSLNN